MKTAILLMGAPQCGKTTLLQKVLAAYPGPVGGFYTREIREDGRRTAFEMVTLDARTDILAGVHLPGPPRVSRYGVDLDALERVALPAIREACERGALVVIDEIGPMETFSQAFCQSVRDTLDAGCPLFGTIVQRSTSFGDEIKGRSEVELVEVTPHDRNDLVKTLLNRLYAMTGAPRRE